MIQENTVVAPVSEQTQWLPGRCRFLGLDSARLAVLMPLDRQQLGPRKVSFDELQQALLDGVLRIEPEGMKLKPEELSERARAEYDFWRPHFAPLLEGTAYDALLEDESRVAVLATLVRVTGKPKRTARRWLYAVLRAGRSLLGLCPDYRHRGGLGKPQRKGSAKRGRKPLPGSIATHVALPDIRPILEAAIRTHVIQNKIPVDTAYYKMLGESFTKTRVRTNGVVETKRYEERSLPTLSQFRRVASQMSCAMYVKPSKRVRGGTAKDGVPGPGYHYEIDATGARLELVSEFNLSQPIGSANAYGLMDVATTVCVGGVLGVFNAGYRAAQVALFNAFTSKKELCARWDIPIEEDAWPCAHVCRYLTSDRGELVSDAAEALPAELNVVVRTAPPYTPESKGTVERWFRDLKAGDIRKLVGFGRKTQRGERDPKEQAALTRYDGMRAFLLLALRHNHQPAPQCTIPPQMLEQGYECITRITLWQWLMQNRVTGARTMEPGLIYTSLLRKADASIRENGLFVEKIRYMSPELRTSGLLQRAALSGAIEVEATVDDFAARTVWYRTSLDAPWLPAYLADDRLKLYDATFDELRNYYRRCEVVHHRTRIESAAFDHATEIALRGISEQAVARQGPNKPHKKAPGNIRAARAVDAQGERREHGMQVLMSYCSNTSSPKRCRSEVAKLPNERATTRLQLARAAFLKMETSKS